MLKKVFLFLAILLVAIPVFAVEVQIDWSWDLEDKDVKYFRYQLDEENADDWTVVDSTVLSYTLIEEDDTVEHALYLQQSYDGIYWSPSTVSYSEAIQVEEAEDLGTIVIEPVPAVEDVVVVTKLPEEATEAEVVEETTEVAEVVEETAVVEEAAPIVATEKNKESNFDFTVSLAAGARGILLDTTGFKFQRFELEGSVDLGFENIIGPWGFRVNTIMAVAAPYKPDFKNPDTYTYAIAVLPAYFTFDLGPNHTIALGAGTQVAKTVGLKHLSNLKYTNNIVLQAEYRANLSKHISTGLILTLRETFATKNFGEVAIAKLALICNF